MIRSAYIDGIALWAPTLPGWDHARAVFRDDAAAADPPHRRPTPDLLPAAERRRASDSVALAVEVAAAAVAQAGRGQDELPSVFVSAHGDLAISDHMCAALRESAPQISPTRFHNSVHNAPAGYWTIAAGCMRASTSIAAYLRSFATGLLEALIQVESDGEAILLVGADICAIGPLASANFSRGLLGAALVLAPVRGERSVAAVDWQLAHRPAGPVAPRCAAARALGENGLADALPLYEALAREAPQTELDLPLAMTNSLALSLRLRPLSSRSPSAR
jgi:hypothetical protein